MFPKNNPDVQHVNYCRGKDKEEKKIIANMERKEGEELKLQLDSSFAGSVLVPKSQELYNF